MSHNDKVGKNQFSEKILFFSSYMVLKLFNIDPLINALIERIIIFYFVKKRQCMIKTKYGQMYLTKYMVMKLLKIDP